MPKSAEDFELKKVIFSDDKVEIYADVKVVRDGKGKKDLLHYTKEAIPHSDLVNLKNKLKDYLIKAYGINVGYEKGLSYAPPSKKEYIENALLDMANKVQVTRLSIGGDDQLRGAVISGKMESFNGSMVAMNSPRIVFSSEILGFESVVGEITDLIEEEVYELIANDKRSDMTLGFGDTDEDDDEDEGENGGVGEPEIPDTVEA